MWGEGRSLNMQGLYTELPRMKLCVGPLNFLEKPSTGMHAGTERAIVGERDAVSCQPFHPNILGMVPDGSVAVLGMG